MENNLNKSTKKCSIVCFIIAFALALIILESEQISLIKGNSYYLSTTSKLIETLLSPLKHCVLYAVVIEIVCQIMIRISVHFTPKEKRNDKKLNCIAIPLLANFIGFIIVAIIVLANLNIPF